MMNEEELLKYELPSISEYISIGWMQEIIARLTANRINRKLRRYKKRKEREEFISKYKEI